MNITEKSASGSCLAIRSSLTTLPPKFCGQEQRAGGYAKTHKFLTGSSYIAAKLTGEYVIDQFLAKASFRPLYNDDAKIDEKECALFCRPDQMAEAVLCTNLPDM